MLALLASFDEGTLPTGMLALLASLDEGTLPAAAAVLAIGEAAAVMIGSEAAGAELALAGLALRKESIRPVAWTAYLIYVAEGFVMTREMAHVASGKSFEMTRDMFHMHGIVSLMQHECLNTASNTFSPIVHVIFDTCEIERSMLVSDGGREAS